MSKDRNGRGLLRQLVKQNKQEPGLKTLWTSLETTKVITPVAIALCTAFLPWQSAQQAERRADDDRANARFATLVNKRAEVWDKMGPHFMGVVTSAFQIMSNIEPANWQVALGHAGSLIDSTNELNALLQTYSPYFSKEFASQLQKVVICSRSLYELTAGREAPQNSGMLTEFADTSDQLQKSLSAIRPSLSAELGVEADLRPLPLAESTCQRFQKN